MFIPFKQKIIHRLIFKEIPKDDSELRKQQDLFFEIIRGEIDNSAAPSGRKTLDILADYEYIYQSFALIGIDLQSELMHWYRFNEILQGLLLKGDCPISKVVEIRNLNPDDFKGKQKAEVYRLKKQFALESPTVNNADDFIMAFKAISKPAKEVK